MMSTSCRTALILALCAQMIGCESRAKAPPPPPDFSLPATTYLERGVPDFTREWNGIDIAEAAAMLTTIANKDADHLPRYQSPRSGAVFARLVADSNLNAYRDRSRLAILRLSELESYMEAVIRITKLYRGAFREGKVGDSELIEFLGCHLRAFRTMFAVANELRPALSTNDTALKGILDQMGEHLGSSAVAATQILTESHVYRKSELKRLVKYMLDTYPDFLPELPESRRTAIVTQLREFCSDPKMAYLNPELSQLADIAEQAN